MARIPVSVRVGDVFNGYCGGFFGRDSYGEKRVEAVGVDWIVVRENDQPIFGTSCHNETFPTEADIEGWRNYCDPEVD